MLQPLRTSLYASLRRANARAMAKSKYEYVKEFELEDRLLPGTWIVIRIDGQNFHRFTADHKFDKPNDLGALNLMNAAAAKVMDSIGSICLAYGESDEFSFVLKPADHEWVYNRRSSKLISSVVSCFSAYYQFLWASFMPDSTPLQYPPTFDGRAVMYPTLGHLRDYLSWRQVDCHVNNLYNTCFWSLVKSGVCPAEAERTLKGTSSGQKNELLFSSYGINYNDLPEIFRKGSTILKRPPDGKADLAPLHVDLIKDDFWNKHASLFAVKPQQANHNKTA